MSSTFESVLDHALNFSRIHGWVVQLEDEIRAVRGFFEGPQADKALYQQVLQNQLGKVTSLEEKLLALVLLRYLEVPSAQIAELFLLHLDGKLSKQERFFLNRHFFGGKNPIPDSISREITDRDFLNYHRAIYTALQISRFESDFDADNVVLGFVHLLCLNSLLDPNRAIILLLLSRIDANLSPGLEKRVKDSMNKLEGIIREVESRRESVLKDSLDSELSSTGNYDWTVAPRETTPPRARPDTLTRQTPSQTPAHDWSEVRSSIKAPQSVEQEQRPGEQFLQPMSSNAPTPLDSALLAKKNPDTASINLPPLTAPTQTNTETPAWDMSIPSPALKKILTPEKTSYESSGQTAPQMAAAELSRAQAPQAEAPEEHPRFTILFNRVTDELQAVIHTLENASKAPANAENTGEQGKKSLQKNRTLFSLPQLPRFMWLAGGCLLLIALLFLVIRCGAGPQAAVAQTAVPATTQQAQPLVPALTAKPAVTLTPSPVKVKELPVHRSGTNWVWVPKTGESLWTLFMKIANKELVFDGSQTLNTADWALFIDHIKSLNPTLLQPDVILPGQEIRIL